MAPKMITVESASGGKSKEKLSNHDEFKSLTESHGVLFLIDDDGCNIRGFESLANGGRYTLGDVAGPPSKYPRRTVFQAGAIIEGALRSTGARGNVYKFLARHKGFYSEKECIQVSYQGDDLYVKAYFKEEEHAMDFQNALNDWETHKELANLDGVDINPKTPLEIDMPDDLERIFPQHYKPEDSESPCHSLNQLHSYRLSIPITEPAETNEPIARYQSLDMCIGRTMPYKCHLKDKARFKALQRNENNMVVASWTFHQFLDGLNTKESIPLVALAVKSTSERRLAQHDNRYSATMVLEFYEKIDAEAFQEREGAKRIDAKTWETVVFVCDKVVFQECVTWKGNDTREKWRRHQEFLDAV